MSPIDKIYTAGQRINDYVLYPQVWAKGYFVQIAGQNVIVPFSVAEGTVAEIERYLRESL